MASAPVVAPLALDGHPFSPLSLESVRASHRSFSRARDWGRYHTPRNLLLALVGEVGELAEVFQWKGEVSEGATELSPGERTNLAEELSDCLLYLVALADHCHVDLAKAVQAKMAKNEEKYPAERVYGSSKKYNLYDKATTATAAAAATDSAAVAALSADSSAAPVAQTAAVPTFSSSSPTTTSPRRRASSPLLQAATLSLLALLSLLCVVLAPRSCEAAPIDALLGTWNRTAPAAALEEHAQLSDSPSSSPAWLVESSLSSLPDPSGRNASGSSLSRLASLCHLSAPLSSLPFLEWDLTLAPYWLLAIVNLLVVLGGYAWTWTIRRTRWGRWVSGCADGPDAPQAHGRPLHMQLGSDDPEACDPHAHSRSTLSSPLATPSSSYGVLCESEAATAQSSSAPKYSTGLLVPPPRDEVFDDAFALGSSFMRFQLLVQVVHAVYIFSTLHPAQSHWNRYEELATRLFNGGVFVMLLPMLHATMLQPTEEEEQQLQSGGGGGRTGSRRGACACSPSVCVASLLLLLSLPALVTHALPGLIFFPIWLAPLLAFLVRSLSLRLAECSPTRGAQFASLVALDAHLNESVLAASSATSTSASLDASHGDAHADGSDSDSCAPDDPDSLAALSRLYVDYEVARDFGSVEPEMSARQRTIVETAYNIKQDRLRLTSSASAWVPTHVRLLLLAVLNVAAAAALTTAVNYATIFYRGRGYMDVIHDEWNLRASGCYQHGLHAGVRTLVFSFFAKF